MPDDNDLHRRDLADIRRSLEQAELLRDQLLAEYRRLCDEDDASSESSRGDSRHRQGLEAMRKAVAAADRAIDSINQALREMGNIPDDPA